ncbi:sodium-independent anion transporter [Neolewinella persica]|uniref:sodium-independent anion transporter n=1 Tax=Neolewinella persica TaxID=70998 RepID=UPI001FE0EF16|nr:sodium-independent anion transporter [Neolewinella persica]
MKKSADQAEKGASSESISDFSIEKPWADEGDLVDRIGDRVFIKHLDGPIFFGFVSSFQTIIQALPNLEVLVIRMGRVPYIDQSGLYAMEDAILDLQNRGVAVVFTGMNDQVRSMMERINLIPGLVDDSYIFDNFSQCRSWLSQRLEEGDLDQVSHRQRNMPTKISDNIDEM